MDKLENCPFCGHSAGIVSTTRGRGFYAACGGCQASVFAMTEEEATAGWNVRTRPEEANVPEGWMLVPKEPTSEMIDAGGNTPKMQVLDGYCSDAQLRGCFTEERLAGPKSDCAIAQCYKAMLACVPQEREGK